MPDVTSAVTSYDLVINTRGEVLRLWDTPGFGDGFRLAEATTTEILVVGMGSARGLGSLQKPSTLARSTRCHGYKGTC